jgi:hypothetical protein
LLALASLASSACQQEEHVILLEVVSPEDVGDLTITVIPLDGVGSPSSAPRPVDQTAAEIRETPLHIAIRLNEPREVMVVLSAEGPSADVNLVAQRCFAVRGVVRDSVWLVALGASEDADGDRFPRRAAATCARPSEDLLMPVACPGTDPVLCAAMGEIDCDDDNPSRYPGAIEMCADGIDQNCDGADASCEDADDDGFSGCRPGPTCTTDAECDGQPCEGGRCRVDPSSCDCNDGDAEAYPGAPDPCMDPTDSDCDGANDLCDADCDGYPDQGGASDAPYFDCDDADAEIHPNETLRGVYALADGDRLANGCDAVPMTTAASDMCRPGGGGEPMGDGLDQDCNGFVDDGPGCTDTSDRDRDGSRACTTGMTTGCDTNDCDPGISPSRTEVCGNAFDEDGDGTAAPCAVGDTDGDGHVANASGGDDCDDTDPQIFAGAPENCLTPVSESCTENIPCTSFGGDADGDGYLTGLPAGARGDCEDRMEFTVGTTMFRGEDVRPFAGEDPCDGIDNNCDGIVDEVLRAVDPSPGEADGCVRTGGGATDVDYHLSAQYSEYCGGCGVVTAANQDCCAGVPTGIDQPTSCGTCGYDCGAHTACPRSGMDTGGDVHACACAPDASGNWDDCDGSLLGASGGNGCETDLDTDENHCGACGNRCGPNATCSGGMCVCDAPFLDCDGNILFPSGCEINGSNDVANCNRCDNACVFSSGSPVCIGGACRLAGCDPGFDNCNGSDADGCETPLTTLGNCGRCGETCGGTVNATEICNGSRACDYSSCDGGFLDCGGGRVNGCETAFSTTNCGACGTVCGPREACNGGGDCQCGSGPSAGTGEACTGGTPDCCGNACVNLTNDVNNCGGCGVRCGPSETCSGGRCVCGGTSSTVGGGEACPAAGSECCGGGCVAIATNASHCGGCGLVCGPSEICSGGRCACGGTTAAAAGSEACAGTGNECCGSTCTDTRTTATSCGMCGRNCATIAVNAAETCAASTCDYSSCDTGFLDCDATRPNGCETNGRALPNCGTCGNNCATILNAVETCTASGTCDYSSCDANFFSCDANRANGCETDGRLLPNCGGCGNTCSSIQNASAVCAGGSCDYSMCMSSFGDCDSMRGNGCETNLSNTLTRCGSCATNCNTTLANTQAAGRTCTASTCDYSACASGFGDCDSTRPNGCETNLASTLTACGSCATNCNTTLQNTAAAGRTCSSSTCNYATCAMGFGDCDGNRANGCEANTASTLTACGATCINCNTALLNTMMGGRSCSTGLCDYGMCSNGFGDCDTNRTNGCETTLGTTMNCGACGHSCGAGETCNGMGECQCGTGGSAPRSGTGEACSGATPTCNVAMSACE